MIDINVMGVPVLGSGTLIVNACISLVLVGSAVEPPPEEEVEAVSLAKPSRGYNMPPIKQTHKTNFRIVFIAALTNSP